MRKFLALSKNLFFIISLITLFASIGLYYNFKFVVQEHENEIYRIELNRAHKTSQTILNQILSDTSGEVLNIVNNTKLEEDISKFLSYYRNDEFKYIYMVYVDKKGSYRYLADGSEEKEKANLNQKFTPSLTALWEKLINEKNVVYDIQNSAEGLWLTHLSPVVKNGQVEAVLVLDISMQEYENFSNLLVPLNNFLNIFLAVLFIVFLVMLAQGLLFYRQFKKAVIDSLTKLYNRHYLENIPFDIKDGKTSILMIDIDYFKTINDKYGHGVGDLVISSIAKKLTTATRLDDTIIRYGGEEFLILIRSAKNKKDVVKIAERIRESIDSEQIRINEKLSIHVTVSLGVNLCAQKINSITEEIKNADKMLYTAKYNGRNRIEVY